jgi:serine/threonine-protein kinase HipA
MINQPEWPKRFKSLDVRSNNNPVGVVSHDSQFVFSYIPDSQVNCSLTMPVRNASYNQGSLHPVFEMNLPEGFLRRYITERLLKQTKINDMLFLALQGNRGIGHLSFHSEIDFGSAKPMAFQDLLSTPKSNGLFDYLLDRYGLTHTLSGMQPKLLVDTDRSTLAYPNCIVKTGDTEFPDLPVNEFVCMRLAHLCGIDVPEHYLSEDHTLFVIERFDLINERKLAFEDFCSLMGKQGQDRYNSSYEAAAKVLDLYNVPASDLSKYFELVVFSVLIGNGDAHLKNFGLLYDPESGHPIPRLAPAYDLTCTLYYEHLDNGLALKLDQEKRFPNKTTLIKFGKRIRVKRPDLIIERLSQGISEGLESIPVLNEYPSLLRTIQKQLSLSNTESASGIKSHPEKNKKFP